MITPIEACFWLSLALLLYTHVGYLGVMVLLARLRHGKRETEQAAGALPSVSVVIAAYNEESAIAPKLRNLLASDYPPALMEIVVVSDGSTDATCERVREIGDARITWIEREERRGKPSCLNAGVSRAKGEIIVFADARQRVSTDAISQLVQGLSHADVGAITGNLMIAPADSAIGGGVDMYWRMEKILRMAESELGCTVGCTGALYAIRRSLFEPIPEDTILDDVVIPMRIATRGFRVISAPGALAWDKQTLDPRRERIRKRRTLAGNFQMLFRYPSWLASMHHLLGLRLFSHKYLRLAGPAFLLALFISNILLADSLFYQVLGWMHGAVYALALMGVILPKRRFPLFSIPSGFLFLNWMVIEGFWYFLFKSGSGVWERVVFTKNSGACVMQEPQSIQSEVFTTGNHAPRSAVVPPRESPNV